MYGSDVRFMVEVITVVMVVLMVTVFLECYFMNTKQK